ncbi:MAG: AIR carboxylase family protein, partial [Planctomycetota bacterium]
KVIIAAAGMAAHLAGAMAAHSQLPIIGVPMQAKEGPCGLDALERCGNGKGPDRFPHRPNRKSAQKGCRVERLNNTRINTPSRIKAPGVFYRTDLSRP